MHNNVSAILNEFEEANIYFLFFKIIFWSKEIIYNTREIIII